MTHRQSFLLAAKLLENASDIFYWGKKSGFRITSADKKGEKNSQYKLSETESDNFNRTQRNLYRNIKRTSKYLRPVFEK